MELEAGDETVTHAEKISSERVMGHEYDVWDVETNKNRWWVITNPTNLYLKDEFKSMDYVLSFHIGLMHRVFARQARSARTGDEEKDRLRLPWRKWEQAAKASEEADEAEEFQAVGMRCREALLAFVWSVAKDEMVPDADEVPKKGDFLHWSEYIAAALTPTSPRLRGYLRKMAANTWDLVNWLTHEANAHRFDAIIAVDATAYTLDVFGMALVRHERGQPERCPECASYRLVGDYRSELDAYVTLCEACEWESEPREASRRSSPS
ncbi:MAG: hypothetical protein ACRDOS_01320 [Gaiellaceae bacterium]